MTIRLTPAQADRACGVLIASAAGDALGAGYEFAHVAPDLVPSMIGGGLGNFASGEWTDDTSQAVAIARVAAAVPGLPRLDRLKTAVGEATMNAMEHGNHYEGEVALRVLRDRTSVRVLITDTGGAATLPDPEAPDLDAKLDGRQTPRGWGLFLIEELVDHLRVSVNGDARTLELVMRDA